MILVFGSSGQVASELKALLPDAVFLGRARADLAEPTDLRDVIEELRPDGIINAAAYTAVDKAEEEEPLAEKINAVAPGEMARAAARLNVPFVHISTDYVFNGAGDVAFSPDSPTGPLGAYGRSKLKGEAEIEKSGANYAILRTSWVFSAHGANFLKTMLRLSETRDRLTVVADQVGGPTPAAAIAEACVTILKSLRTRPDLSGTYHFSGAPDVSWAEFAREIFRQARRTMLVEDIPTSGYPTPAARPANSRLDCGSLRAFGLERPDWRKGVADVLQELGVNS
ncbi:dTDP-4-dehydrorhamnose reductase [Roseibium aggregatum]|uniref:dTDP-4-dehydrorhamnose reductase n=1 Tax=Roseibium aggregatum TaxID=187304 RepID=A0A939EC40_9HYPH|nr:dTDP-4-dehydrorhamnose reductase [Roseibium aggregatum]MBN9669859.1 dTDP-4-dehydrorhamnose reductase [Roseibium aggregatum]